MTDLHPVLTQNTDVRKINAERIKLQIIEAAEQCERLDIPVLHEIESLFKSFKDWDQSVPLFAALERFDARPLHDFSFAKDSGFLIGPAGGFTEEEKEKLAGMDFVTPVSLGENILRSETAAIAALSLTSL